MEGGTENVVCHYIADDLGHPAGVDVRRFPDLQLLEIILEPEIVFKIVGNVGGDGRLFRIRFFAAVCQKVESRFRRFEGINDGLGVFGVLNVVDALLYLLLPILSVFIVLLRAAVVVKILRSGVFPLAQVIVYHIPIVLIDHGVVGLVHNVIQSLLRHAVGNVPADPAGGFGGEIGFRQVLDHIGNRQGVRKELPEVVAHDEVVGNFLRDVRQELGHFGLIGHFRRCAPAGADVVAVTVGGKLQADHVALFGAILTHAHTGHLSVYGIHPAGHGSIIELSQPVVFVFFQRDVVVFQIVLHVTGQADVAFVDALQRRQIAGAVFRFDPGLFKGTEDHIGTGISLIKIHLGGIIEIPLTQCERFTGQNHLALDLFCFSVSCKNRHGSR